MLNKKKCWFIFSLSFALFWVFACVKSPQACEINWTNIEAIQHSFKGKKPMNVGFDIDDTVLFSSPAFYYGSRKYSPNEQMKFLQMPEFWLDMNTKLDQFSLPKQTAIELIKIHQKRGDHIFFITARPKTKQENLTQLLQNLFQIEKMNPIIFTGMTKDTNPKVTPIQVNAIKVFYGDSDVDISASNIAKIRGIRILRAENSLDKPFPNVGCLGEEVIKGSGV